MLKLITRTAVVVAALTLIGAPTAAFAGEGDDLVPVTTDVVVIEEAVEQPAEEVVEETPTEVVPEVVEEVEPPAVEEVVVPEETPVAEAGRPAEVIVQTPAPVKIVTPPAIAFVDKCGRANDLITPPRWGTGLGYIFVTTNQRPNQFLQGFYIPLTGFAFPEGFNRFVDVRNTDVPCPMLITSIPAPTFVDECGTANDDVVVPAAGTGWFWETSHVLNDGFAAAWPEAGYAIAPGVTSVFETTFTDVPCPVVPAPVPAAPAAPAAAVVAAPVTPVEAAPVVESEGLASTGVEAGLIAWAAALALMIGLGLAVGPKLLRR